MKKEELGCQDRRERGVYMKTEKELKDELEDIFFDALTDKSNPPYYTDKVDPENDGYWQWKVYELCADELIKRGYGDVSEYKAEIERLKAEVKQAKIDILNKVKDVLDNAPNGWTYTTYIDELIEEIEKQ